MKKWFLCLCLWLSLASLGASEPEKVEMLLGRVILENTQGYFTLADGSHWKVIAFSKRWRSLTEWWRGEALIPENYNCQPKEWLIGTEIAVYRKYGNLEVKESDAANQEMIRQSTHLFANTRTGQILFAIALDPALCLSMLYKEAKKEGETKGFEKGRMSTYRNGTEIYDQGYQAGYTVGYQQGFEEGLLSR